MKGPVIMLLMVLAAITLFSLSITCLIYMQSSYPVKFHEVRILCFEGCFGLFVKSNIIEVNLWS